MAASIGTVLRQFLLSGLAGRMIVNAKWQFVAPIALCWVLAGCGGDSAASDPVVVLPTPAATPSPTPDSLITAARGFAAMPKDLTGLLALRGGGTATFASGLPLNDLEHTLYDTDYIDGETTGYDTFMPVDPGLAAPGADQIKIVNAVANIDLDNAYSGAKGDRIILGTAEIGVPFFTRGANGRDDDFAVITNFDFRNGHIQLRGSAADYGLVRCTRADGCQTDGFYLFHTASSTPDLIAFIFPCDDPALPVSGNPFQNPTALCNGTRTLSLNDTNQFRFATPKSTVIAAATAGFQVGGSGREIIGDATLDADGNIYLVGQSDSDLDASGASDNAIVIASYTPVGTRRWLREIDLPNASQLIDAAVFGDHLYAVGRTLGALPGHTNAGRYDGIILKYRLSDGALVASHQFGNEGLDGYGNITFDDAGNLFVSGQGSPAGATGTDPNYLVAKHRQSDLAPVWRQIVPPTATGTIFVAEAFGGLTYVPSDTPGAGRLVAGGWYLAAGGANGFLEVWENLNAAAPVRTASAIVTSSGTQAEWVLDNVVDAAGNIYAVGFTSGSLEGAARGNVDAYVVRFDRDLRNPVYRQFGTAQADAFRRMRLGSDGSIYAIGYSYGDYAQANADGSRMTGDIVVQKLSLALAPIGSLQFGTPHEDRGYIELRGDNLLIGGMTEAAMAGANRGAFDLFAVQGSAGSLLLRR